MFRQPDWARLTVLLGVVFIVVVTDRAKPGLSQVVGPTAGPPVLTGKWKLDTGEIIDITQSASGQVTAKFVPPTRCWDLERKSLFEGKVKTAGSGATASVTIENGRFWACTRTERMWKECPTVSKLFETKLRNVTVSPYSITGEVLRPGYYLPDGDFRRCRPDSQYEGWESFSLTPLCRPATPWFDKDTNCADAQRPVITTSPGHVVLSICGSEIYRHSFDHQPYLEEYAAALVERVKQQVGSTVCCQSFREALRSGQPCNPGSDVDCDGRPNQTDEVADAPFPDINIFTSPPGASIAPFPPGLDPDDPNFLPGSTARESRDVGDCDCKWELTKGVLNCGTGGQRHSYVATWKCPTTGAEVITTKYATANTPCP